MVKKGLHVLLLGETKGILSLFKIDGCVELMEAQGLIKKIYWLKDTNNNEAKGLFRNYPRIFNEFQKYKKDEYGKAFLGFIKVSKKTKEENLEQLKQIFSDLKYKYYRI